MEENNLTTFGEKTMLESDEWSFDVTFEFVVHGILINSVGVLGLLGNVVSIVVLSRPQMKSSINTLLIGLVGCDSLLIITSIFMFCFTVFRYTGSDFFHDYYWTVYPYVVPFVYPVALMAQTGSAYLTLAVTIERYLVKTFYTLDKSYLFRANTYSSCSKLQMGRMNILYFNCIMNCILFLLKNWIHNKSGMLLKQK